MMNSEDASRPHREDEEPTVPQFDAALFSRILCGSSLQLMCDLQQLKAAVAIYTYRNMERFCYRCSPFEIKPFDFNDCQHCDELRQQYATRTPDIRHS